jgi:hypothetical protein
MYNKQDILDKIEFLIKKRNEINSWQAKLCFNTLNRCLSYKQIEIFEKEKKIILPSDYKFFIAEIGNGGIGPDYGLFSLEESIIDIKLKNRPIIKTNIPFQFTGKWNETWIENFDWDNDIPLADIVNNYMSVEYIYGCLQISHAGHGCTHLLVVNGKEFGYIWFDGRANYDGLFPELNGNEDKQSFIDWYMEWMNIEIKKIAN